jgi:hypothetical protein
MLDSYQKDGFAADSLVNSVLKYNDKDLWFEYQNQI